MSSRLKYDKNFPLFLFSHCDWHVFLFVQWLHLIRGNSMRSFSPVTSLKLMLYLRIRRLNSSFPLERNYTFRGVGKITFIKGKKKKIGRWNPEERVIVCFFCTVSRWEEMCQTFLKNCICETLVNPLLGLVRID